MSDELYKKIGVAVESATRYSIPISGQCGALTELTIVGGLVSIPHRILGASIFFPDNAINNVRVYLLESSNQSTSTTGLPAGDNVFSRFSPTAYFIGHDEVIMPKCRLEVLDVNRYIKLHINNLNNWVSDIQAVVNLEAI